MQHHFQTPIPQRVDSRAAWRMVVLYATFSCLWILGSDTALVHLFDAQSLAAASMLKGGLFVAVTSVFLYSLIRRLLNDFNRTIGVVEEREAELIKSARLLLESQQIAGLGSYELDIARGTWKSSIVCDQVLGIGADFDRTLARWASLVHPDDWAGLNDYFTHEVLAGRQPFARDYRIVRPVDQDVRWVRALGQLELDGQGQAQRLRGTLQDITLQKNTEEQISAAKNRLQATLDALPDLLFEVSEDGRIHQYHSHRSDLLAAPPALFLGRKFDELLPPAASAVCFLAIQDAVHCGFSTGRRYALPLPQGERWFDLSVAPLPARGDPDRRFIFIARDVTERKAAEAQLELAGRVFNHAREGIMVTDAQGLILDVNEAFSRITGYAREEAIGQNPRMLSSGRQGADFYSEMWRSLHNEGFWTGEVWNRRKDGAFFVELLTISAVRNPDGEVLQYVALFSDITALKIYQTELEHIAHFDALTNLPNRLLLADRLQQAMNHAQRREKMVAVVYLDLDGFKTVNDQHGHEVGDKLLIALGQRMRSTLRDGDTLARIGGDEFVAVLIDLEDTEASLPLVARLMGLAAEPVQVDDLTLHVSASAGITFFPQPDDLDAEQLLRQADQAMYQAKVAGKNRYHVFDAKQDTSLRVHHESLERIRLALANDEFVLHYQPKVNMRLGTVIGVEALIRWQHPEQGLLSPAAFLSVIEGHPLAIAIGEWVIAQALRQHVAWKEAGLHLPVSVNVGALQLQQPQFVAQLQARLQQFPTVSPHDLEIEILETSALQDMAQVSGAIDACKKMGIAFALDDFGTGYSSLTYLRQLQVATLKIDQSFVRDMLENTSDLAILRGVIGLAQAFGRQVIAEGVESVAHGAKLLQLGCDLAQGYGIARPLVASQVPQWVAQWRPDPSWRDC